MLKNQKYAVVFVVPHNCDYKGAKGLEATLYESGLSHGTVTAVTGRQAGVCTRKRPEAVHWKDWFPADTESLEVILLSIHSVDESILMPDGRWCVKVIADISFEAPEAA